MKTFLFFFTLINVVFPFNIVVAQDHYSVPLAGNTFSSNHFHSSRTVTNNGIENWTDAKETFTTYIHISQPGEIAISINEISSIKGKSTLEFSINNTPKTITLDEREKFEGHIGRWIIKEAGYVAIQIKGLTNTNSHFPSIAQLNVGGSAINANTRFIKNNEGNFYYWGRRGPSVHLSYHVPHNTNVLWYYNEITVPENNDVIGSYYMANGFNEGYFGIQVNSATERRVLFSVWSPFETDNPKHIPEKYKIKLLKKGRDVNSGEFGNEGSGGQSYLKFNWLAGNTYKFLLKGTPSSDSSTTYTAYFYAPELNSWQLIASFKRPQTKTFLKGFYSFLENFSPGGGDITRKVLFNNQWVCDDKGDWTEIIKASFTTDDTGNKKYRMDFSGGVDKNQFYLKNCGFFNEQTTPKSIFIRPSTNKKPVIDFNKLP